ncbi:phycocyanin operon protein Z [Aphanothece hegewaldii CCALA 016]|uniref:Phycocyanin operon protein Z n=1 Tax=Aphanothece hegewaldii CCALA 016 TaxID=2107694 RepID=A0A2T1LZX4_9CHRO|nr:HEAT repeat domain-containing protein [Aphanothece hegewaldii]PSF37952.1 phycocyanin operon protein Z [Aphanothece hegewaldii CCALA 016]
MTIDTLFEQLNHPNPYMRKRAMLDLAEVRDETTIPRLMQMLDEADVSHRRSAVVALGVIGVDAVPPVVETLLNSQNTTIKGSCVKALAQISLNHPEVSFPEMGLQGLKQSLNDPDPVVYIASAMALGQIGTPALDILIESLKTTDNLALSIAIINALGSIGDRRGLEVLTELANNETVDEYVRESATSALSRLEFITKQ